MKIYVYKNEKGNIKFIDEKATKILKNKEYIEEIKLNYLNTKLLINNKELWLNNEIYNRNKNNLKKELIILNAVDKIKDQLKVTEDVNIVLTSEEKSFIEEIKNKLFEDGIILKHDLADLDKNHNIWLEKIEKDKKELEQDTGVFLTIE